MVISEMCLTAIQQLSVGLNIKFKITGGFKNISFNEYCIVKLKTSYAWCLTS